jgi:cytochrome c oxidase cbb3-type subunit III
VITSIALPEGEQAHMKVWTGAIAAAVLGLTMAAGAEQPPATQQPPTEGHGGPPPPGTQPAPPQGGFPQGPARFPAHQRPPIEPAVLERGRGVYVGSCGACHGVDARGGQLGGPNLLRSQLVLSDQDGELIAPVVKNGRPGTLMVPLPIADADIKAIAGYLHSLQAQGSNQGGPPPGPPVELNILLGDARAGEKYFAARCSTCHSAAADLQGLATRVPDPKTLQNLWVSGGRAAGGGRRGGGRPVSPTSVPTATVTWPSGERVEGRLLRLDDFIVAVALADGTTRTIRRDGDVPAVDVKDPLSGHRELLSILTDANMHDVTAYLATLK